MLDNLLIPCHEHAHTLRLYQLRFHGTDSHPSRAGLDSIKISDQLEIYPSDYIKDVLRRLEASLLLIKRHEFATLQLISHREDKSFYTGVVAFLVIDMTQSQQFMAADSLIKMLKTTTSAIAAIDFTGKHVMDRIAFTTNHCIMVRGDSLSFSPSHNPNYFEMNRYELTLLEKLLKEHTPKQLDRIIQGRRIFAQDPRCTPIKGDIIDSLLHIGGEQLFPRIIKTGMIPSAIILTRSPQLYTDGLYVRFTHTTPRESGFNLMGDLLKDHGMRRLFLRNLLFLKVGGDWNYTKEVVKVFDAMRKWDQAQIDVSFIEDLLDSETYTTMENSKVSEDIANYLRDIFSMPVFNSKHNPLRVNSHASKYDLTQSGFFVMDVGSLSIYQEYAIICYLFAMRQYQRLPHHIITSNPLLFNTDGIKDQVVLGQMLDRHLASGLMISSLIPLEESLTRKFEILSFEPTITKLMEQYEVVTLDSEYILVFNNLLTIASQFFENPPDSITIQEREEEQLFVASAQPEETYEEEAMDTPNSTRTFVHMATVLSFMREYRSYTKKELILGLEMDDEFVDTAVMLLLSRNFVEESGEGIMPTIEGYGYISNFLQLIDNCEIEIENLFSQLSNLKLSLYTANLEQSRQGYAMGARLIREHGIATYYHIAIGILAGSYQMEVDQPIAKSALIKEFMELVSRFSDSMVVNRALVFGTESEDDIILDTVEEVELEEEKEQKLRDEAVELVIPKVDPMIRIVDAIVPKNTRMAPSAPPPRSTLLVPRKTLTPEDLKPKCYEGLRSWYRFSESDYSRPIKDIAMQPQNIFLLYYLFQRIGSNNEQQFIKTTRIKVQEQLDDLDLKMDLDLDSPYFTTHGSLLSFPNFNDLFVPTTVKLDALYARYDLQKVSQLLEDTPQILLESDAIASIIIRDANKKVLDQVAAFCFMLIKSGFEGRSKYVGLLPHVATMIKYGLHRRMGERILHPLLRTELLSDTDKAFIAHITGKYTKTRPDRTQKIRPLGMVVDEEFEEIHEEVVQEMTKSLKLVKAERKVVGKTIQDDLIPLDASLQQKLLMEISELAVSPELMLFHVFSSITRSITGVRIDKTEQWKELMTIFTTMGSTTNVLTTGFTRQFADLMGLWEPEGENTDLLSAYRRVLRDAITKFKFSAEFGKKLKAECQTLVQESTPGRQEP